MTYCLSVIFKHDTYDILIDVFFPKYIYVQNKSYGFDGESFVDPRKHCPTPTDCDDKRPGCTCRPSESPSTCGSTRFVESANVKQNYRCIHVLSQLESLEQNEQ